VFYNVISGGAMWQWQPVESLTLTAAIRRDHLELARKGTIPQGYGLTNSDWNRSLGKTSYNVGLVWALSDINTLRLIAARGAQLPSLFNLGGLVAQIEPTQLPPGVVGFAAGIPGLKPATVNSYELAWDHKFPTANTDLRAAVFHGSTSDILANFGNNLQEAAIFDAPGNIGKSQTDGLEFSLQGTLAETWRWHTGYVYQEVDDTFAARFPTARTLINFESTTPRHSVIASLGWTRSSWEVDTYLNYKSRFFSIRDDDTFVPDPSNPFTLPSVLYPVPSYVTVDARIGYHFNEKMDFAISGQNLFTAEQRQTAGPDVERRVLATLTYEF